MKQVNFWHLTRLGKQGRPILQTHPTTDQPQKSRWHLPLRSGVLVVAVLVGALVFSITAGNAHAAGVKKPTSSQVGQVSVTSTVLTALQNSAGDPCRTLAFKENYLVAGNIVTWLKMVTTWCYNHVIVTSHKTTLSWGITAFGQATGWNWIYNPHYTFNCYVASGGNHPCAGNHEWTEQLFDDAFTRSGIALTINEWENYNGQSFARDSHRYCPGGCSW